VHYAWVDLETAGLDERSHPILEVALVVTGVDLIEIAALTLVVNPAVSGGRWASWRDQMDSVVEKMHLDSGLAREVDFGVSLRTADEALAQTLDRLDLGDFFILAGSEVDRFDRRFIGAQLPRLASHLDPKRSFDVASLRRAFRDLAGRADLMPEVADSAQRTHRAMDDIQAHVTEARIYAEYLRLIPEEV
jgi:oligoribonuclease (3'-5' exoribonuclease)